MGLKKPTISSYVQGYALAPITVIEQLASFSGKSVGWFYFGSVEVYIRDYLLLTDHEQLMNSHPEIIKKIKQEFYTGDFKNPGWRNEVGYPSDEFIQDCFMDYSVEIMRNYVTEITQEVIEESKQLSELPEKAREEVVIVISSRIIDYINMSGDIDYGEKDQIVHMVKEAMRDFDVKNDLKFQNQYLVSKLINILGTEEDIELFISSLSILFTDKPFSTRFGGEELVKIFQLMRPALIQLYQDKAPDDFYKWFEK